ncbi:4'-phosphopantetheinyl transferase superfamily protein [Prodigiosinella aquatilis]|nr:4'-phosphopantetheinyl transferase superfamily protein [Prodigiosinella sp. LS101]WJV54097.1 4'-phosphopantetheinyl transferase superfamily protein [Prodigiosinella sp. LS101]WJV58460.1 4'-phosphopantetheinyl transferase superfamily protein [Pectobacteriaceae bacterium C111]
MLKATSSIHTHSLGELADVFSSDPCCVVVGRSALESPALQAVAGQACNMVNPSVLTPRQLAEGIARLLLAPYCHQMAVELQFARGPWGKPFLPHHPAVQFNISHTAAACAFVIANGSRVGVDVEGLQGQALRKRDVAKRFFHPDELQWLLQYEEETQFITAFTRLWTRKEAYIKALGTGLFKSLTSFSCLTGLSGGVTVVDEMQPVDCQLNERWLEGTPSVALSYCIFPSGVSQQPVNWEMFIINEQATLTPWL